MARVTVEDCLANVKNRFELVLLAAKRARQLAHGQESFLPVDNDKPTVLALREIAAGYTNFDRKPATELLEDQGLSHFTATPSDNSDPVKEED